MVISVEDDGSLNIFPITKSLEKALKVKLQLEEFPNLKALEYNIITYYIQGADQIDIVSKQIIPAEQKKRLKLLRLEMPGVEVSEEGANRISYQVLIDPTSFHLESLLNKTSAFSQRLQKDIMNSIINWNFPLAREVLERSGEALRHYRLTIRQVALASISRKIAKQIGIHSCQECITFALIARDLSRLVYHCSQIAKHFLSLENKNKVSARILNLVNELSDLAYAMQKDATQSFLLKDTKLAVQVLRRMRNVREREKKLLKEVISRVKDIDSAVTMSLIARDLRRIAGYSIAISDDGMNRVSTPLSSLR
jgi:phosphate uptake regulator